MEFLNAFLPIVLYIFGIALLIVLIVLGIRLIQTIDRANRLLDDVEEKVSTLNNFFHLIDTITDNISFLSDRVVDAVSNVITKLFRRKKKEEDDYE